MNFGFVLFEEVHKDKSCTAPQSQAVQCTVLWAEQLPGKTLYPVSGRVHLHFVCQPNIRQQNYTCAGRRCCCGWAAFRAHTSLPWCVFCVTYRGVFTCHVACWEEFHLGTKVWPISVAHFALYPSLLLSSLLGTSNMFSASFTIPYGVRFVSSISFIVNCVCVCVCVLWSPMCAALPAVHWGTWESH